MPLLRSSATDCSHGQTSETMRRLNSNMMGCEIEQAKLMLNLTDGQLGRFLGVDNSTIRRWREERKEIPIQVAMILRLMMRYSLDARAIYLEATGKELT